jgi:hypothetical protein
VIFGIVYTIFSEWLNVVVRAAWSYSAWMPVVPFFKLRIGLAPLAQWVFAPSAAFVITWRVAVARGWRKKVTPTGGAA